jgi:hypothetical protein
MVGHSLRVGEVVIDQGDFSSDPIKRVGRYAGRMAADAWHP